MFKRQLKAFLHKRGVTVAELARRTGIPKQTISDWLSGTRPRNMDYVRRLAEELDVDVAQLFFGVPDEEGSIRKSPGLRERLDGVTTVQRYFDFFFENSVAMNRILDLRTGFPSALSLAWERILGWPRPKLMKTHWLELIHPDDRGQVVLVSERHATTDGVSFSNCEHRLLTASGEYMRVHTRLCVDIDAQVMASISQPV